MCDGLLYKGSYFTFFFLWTRKSDENDEKDFQPSKAMVLHCALGCCPQICFRAVHEKRIQFVSFSLFGQKKWTKNTTKTNSRRELPLPKHDNLNWKCLLLLSFPWPEWRLYSSRRGDSHLLRFLFFSPFFPFPFLIESLKDYNNVSTWKWCLILVGISIGLRVIFWAMLNYSKRNKGKRVDW